MAVRRCRTPDHEGEEATMLVPVEALASWSLLAVLAALLVWRWRRHWLIWCGLAVATAGAVYMPSVMAHRPEHYYALLEFLASTTAAGAGLVMVAVGVVRLLS
jgi:hypothetical protein